MKRNWRKRNRLLKYGREDAMAPLGADGNWIVMRAGEQVAGPFAMNADAWRWIDRSQGEPINPTEKKSESIAGKIIGSAG